MSAERGSLDVNGQIIPLAEIKKRAAELRHSVGAQDTSVDAGVHWQEQAAHALLERALLVQEAVRLFGEPAAAAIDSLIAEHGRRYDGVAGCRAGSDTPELREDLRRRLLIDALLEHWRSTIRRPSAEEVRSFYSKNKQKFFLDERVWASQIVRPFAEETDAERERSLTEELRSRIAAGEDFAELAV
ncbi:MAG: hypothetical protein INR62_11385, partial [Rhodospirillales bacterium]|nr:hypothetical protein [Acetobacter sp.]